MYASQKGPTVPRVLDDVSVVCARRGTDTCNKIVAFWPARAVGPDSSITLSIRRVNQSSFSEVQGARRVNNRAEMAGADSTHRSELSQHWPLQRE